MLSNLKQQIDFYQNSYNNSGSEIISDEQFDSMVRYYEELSGQQYNVIGAKSDEGDIDLPVFAGSLDKIKDIKAGKTLMSFLDRYNDDLINMDKYDGISVICNYNNGNLIIQKRGDGSKGPDISFIQQSLYFPRLEENIIIRGELVMYNSVFEELKPYLHNKGNKAVNSRNVVNGATSRVNPDHFIISKCVFIPYSIYKYKIPLKQSEQLDLLRSWGFTSVEYILISKETVDRNTILDYVMRYLDFRKERAPYGIDGTVLCFNIPIFEPEIDKNPNHAVAIKKDTVSFSYVRSCYWNVTSKDGYLTPVIQIDPVTIITTVTNITLNNARFILNNNIGEGAYIAITQGGDIIPKFLWTVTPASVTFSPKADYIWDENFVEIKLRYPERYPQVKCCKMKYFFDRLGMKKWGLITIMKLYQAGLTTLDKIIRVTIPQLMEADNIKEKTAQGLLEELHKGLEKATLPKIMAGSCIFGEGIGEGVLQKFIDGIPGWRTRSPEILYQEILQLRDFAHERAYAISSNILEFTQWLDSIPELEGKTIQTIISSQVLLGYVFYFTGFTDKLLEEKVKSYSGQIKDNMVNAVNVVVRKDSNFSSAKTEKALASGGSIRLITRVELDKWLSEINLCT